MEGLENMVLHFKYDVLLTMHHGYIRHVKMSLCIIWISTTDVILELRRDVKSRIKMSLKGVNVKEFSIATSGFEVSMIVFITIWHTVDTLV